MRYVFGLGGILITLGIIVWLLAAPGGPGDYTVTVLKKGQEAQEQARTLAGVDDTGMRVSESVVLDPVMSGSRLTALTVTSIVPGGPMQARMGLAAGDKIVEVGPQRVRDIDDPEMAKAQVYEATQRSWKLVIERNGAKFEMPGAIPLDASGNAVPAAAATPPPPQAPVSANNVASPQPANPTPAQAPPKRSSIYDQVNAIPGVQRGDN
jgi:hypothetical protein